MSPWAAAASVVLHAALVALLALVAGRAAPPSGRPVFIALTPFAAPSSRAVQVVPPGNVDPRAGALDGTPGSASKAPRDSTLEQLLEHPPLLPTRVESLPASPGTTLRSAAPAPSLGSGVLWDRRRVPPALMARTHAELTDSAVKALINHYLDSVAALPNGGKVLPPTWTATIGGQEFGLDGAYVTVAGLKIPALVLGLIPLPVGGNESEALDNAGWMRQQDYDLAMPRNAIAADQQAEIKAIRKRKAAEQELRRRQMAEAPPP